ncbi:MAG TPA: hypothetical protein VG964_00450 [Candidatus Saccharimonadales bacterium]|nr:hypothetical protein [Candidatus Saccharimonadales bacterium]
MAAIAEQYPPETDAPQPGTIEHLEYLANLEIPEKMNPAQLPWFLYKHEVFTSIEEFVRRNQTPLALEMPGSKTVDSRAIRAPKNPEPQVSATLVDTADRFQILVNGTMNPADEAPFVYSLFLDDFNQEAQWQNGPAFLRRKIKANGHDREESYPNPNYEHGIYRTTSAEEYEHEHDPTVFIKVLKLAAVQLAEYAREAEQKQGSIQALHRALEHQRRHYRKRQH